MKKGGESLQKLWVTIKCTNIFIMGVSNKTRKKKRWKPYFKKMTCYFITQEKEIDQINEVKRNI